MFQAGCSCCSCWNMSCSHQVGGLLNYKFRSLSPRCHGWSIGDITKDAPMVQKCDIQKGWSGFREVGGLGLWLGGCRFCTLNQTSFPPDLVETSSIFSRSRWLGMYRICAGENFPKMVGKGTNLQPQLMGAPHIQGTKGNLRDIFPPLESRKMIDSEVPNGMG